MRHSPEHHMERARHLLAQVPGKPSAEGLRLRRLASSFRLLAILALKERRRRLIAGEVATPTRRSRQAAPAPSGDRRP